MMTAPDAWQTRELRNLVAGLDAGHVTWEEFAERDALLCASLDFDEAEQELARTLAGPPPPPEPERSRCVHCGADIYRASPRARWCLAGFDQVIGGGWLGVASDLIPPSEDVTEGKLKQAPAAAVLLAGGVLHAGAPAAHLLQGCWLKIGPAVGHGNVAGRSVGDPEEAVCPMLLPALRGIQPNLIWS